MRLSYKSGAYEAVAVLAGAVVGAYTINKIPYIADHQVAKALIGFALAWFGASYDGLIGDAIMGYGLGVFIIQMPYLVQAVKGQV